MELHRSRPGEVDSRGRGITCSGRGWRPRFMSRSKPVDMRKEGFEGLYGLVRDQLGADPLSGHLFLFSNRTRTRLKALVWDGSGLWVCAKRLEKGRFGLPEA